MTFVSEQTSIIGDIHPDCISAHVIVHPNGRYVYSSNRVDNSIAIYSFDGEHVKLEKTVKVKTDWPRNFTLSKDSKFMIIGGQKSDNIIVLKVAEDGSDLTETGIEVKLSKPVCMLFQ